MLRIDCYTSWPHYAAHCLPVWRALPENARGTFYAPRHVVAAYPNSELVEGIPPSSAPAPVLTAGWTDYHAVKPRPCFLVNHGAGQTYAQTKAPESFSGGPNRDRVLLHLEPGPLAARASDAAGHRYAEVGMPLLDPWHHTRPIPQRGLVAVALHHNGRGAPEQMPAFPFFQEAFAKLAGCVDLVGHGHPRGWERTANRWRKLGVPVEPDFATVLDKAALLITDISSAGPMFASTNRPVVWLSAPWHLTAPKSGGRFYDWVQAVEDAGGHVTDPEELCDVVRRHLARPQPLVDAQRPIVEDCFAYTDGMAAQRAASEIMRVLDT